MFSSNDDLMVAPAPENDGLLDFMYACPFGLVELDAAGKIGMINPHAMQHLLALAGAHAVDNFFEATEKYAPELRNLADGFAESEGMICDGHRIFVNIGRRHGGRDLKVLSCTLVKRGADQLIATLTDISAQVSQEHRLRQADTWFSSLIDEINDHALLTLDGDGKVLLANDSFERQTGHVLEDVIGQPIENFFSEVNSTDQTRLSIEDQLALATRDGWHLFEGPQRRASGEVYWCQRLIATRAEYDGQHNLAFSVVLRDVPEPEEKADDLIELLTRDYLTGATNRMQFQKTLKREHMRYQRRQRPLSLIILDLDNFKALNDSHGHPAGDAVLKEVARVALDCAPDNGTFARLGGEEFALLLPNCPMSAARDIAEKLRRAIAGLRVAIDNVELSVTVSIGCSEMSETDGSSDDLISIADDRLYQAKRAGRDRIESTTP